MTSWGMWICKVVTLNCACWAASPQSLGIAPANATAWNIGLMSIALVAWTANEHLHDKQIKDSKPVSAKSE